MLLDGRPGLWDPRMDGRGMFSCFADLTLDCSGKLYAPHLLCRIQRRRNVANGKPFIGASPDGVTVWQSLASLGNIGKQIEHHCHSGVRSGVATNEQKIRQVQLLHTETQEAEAAILLSRDAHTGPKHH